MRARKVLLVNYGGYWMTGNTFVADGSLALLAGVLRARDIPVEILDFQTPEETGQVLDALQGPDDPPARMARALAAREALGDRLVGEYYSAQMAGMERWEAQITERILAKIEDDGVGFVGFRLWVGNGLRGSVRIARAIRKHRPQVKLIGGGPALQYLEETFVDYTDAFDCLIYNEAESALPAYVLGEGEVTNAIVFEGGRARKTPRALERDLSALPRPVYDAETYPAIGSFYRMRILDDSRGCFNRCSFCSHTHINGVGVRRKDPARVVDEMAETIERDGIRYFRLSGSNPPRVFLLKVAAEIRRRGLDVAWGAFSSMNNMRVEDLEPLRASGLRALLFGIETADPRLLREVLGKNNRDAGHIVAVCQAAMRLDIFVSLSTIVPSPFETDATKQATSELLRRIFERERHGSVVVFPAVLAPGSLWWEERERYGFAFSAGVGRREYLLELAEMDSNFLLPRHLVKSLPVTMNGKSSATVLRECQAFIEGIEAEGVPTNIDDASYMLALMSGLPAPAYKARMTDSLVRGGVGRLTRMVRELNGAAGEVRGRV